MKTISVYGASDDLIEIEGDLREELYSNDSEPTHIVFSEGTMLSIVYGNDGCWRINVLHHGKSEIEKIEAEGPDSSRYSDRVTITGEIEWVIGGKLIK